MKVYHTFKEDGEVCCTLFVEQDKVYGFSGEMHVESVLSQMKAGWTFVEEPLDKEEIAQATLIWSDEQ